jgi:betaine-homocysteine S-methyltransferase
MNNPTRTRDSKAMTASLSPNRHANAAYSSQSPAVPISAETEPRPPAKYDLSVNGLHERLEQDVVLGAEGYLFELERRGYLKSGPYVPEVVLDFPEAVRELHREFLRAGAEVMVAFTYYGHREKLRMIGREDDLEPLNRHALRLAKDVASEGDALVAGNICNTWVFDPDAPESSGEIVREMYREQVAWAAEEGADLVIAETNDYLGEALIGVEVIQEFGLPSIVTFASTSDTTIDGYEFDEACKRLEAAGADVVGLNCSRGPQTILPLIEKIRAAVDCAVAAQPVPYRTTPDQPTFQSLREPGGGRVFPLGLDPFVCTRFELADFAAAARDAGVGYIGVCCGGAPHHIRAMAESLGRTVPASRYSPDLTLHPVLGDNVQQKEQKFANWKD